MTYKVTVENGFTGRGPGGVAFADGTATGVGERMAEWFKEHKGYTVTPESRKAAKKSEAEPKPAPESDGE